MEGAKKYIEDVTCGRAVVCKYVLQAVERHLRDLERSAEEDFPFYFDEEQANRYLAFIRAIKHSKGRAAGKPFQLQPWQEFIFACVYGWRKKTDGSRRFQRAYIEVARKNGKTEMMAAAALCALLMDKEKGAEVYTAATKRDQAQILFRAAQSMARQLRSSSKALSKLLSVNRTVITFSDSRFEPLGADADTLDGLFVHCAVVDEYHAHKSDEVLKVLETAVGDRLQPLIWIITTAGFNRHGPCFALREVVLNVLSGNYTDESLFGIVYTLDDGDEWGDERVWVKANPNLGITPTWDNLRNAYVRAKNEGASAEVQFRTKHLNEWVSVSRRWIPAEVWDSCRVAYSEEELRGRPCYGGLDLSTVRDMSAFVLFFPARHEEEKHRILVWAFCPEERVRVRADAVFGYGEWVRSGELIATEGNVIDYEYIRGVILQAAERYDIKCIAYDRYNANQLVMSLEEEGLRMVSWGRGFVSMSTPTKELEKMVFGGELEHNTGGLVAWHLSNVELMHDPAGNVKPVKRTDDGKIDSVVALVMAIGVWMAKEKKEPERRSIYELD
ncbi:MAG: terminase [Chitinophagales bacterium]|nr:MAG: terminase [Chitinophagales bacterium]